MYTRYRPRFYAVMYVYVYVYSITHCSNALIKYIPLSCGALTDRMSTTFDCPRSCPIVADETVSLSRETSWTVRVVLMKPPPSEFINVALTSFVLLVACR